MPTGDRQAITLDKITASYTKIPLKFTPKADSSEGRFEILGAGIGSLHIG